MKVRVQYGPDWRAQIKVTDTTKRKARIEGPGGNWRCPRCGGLQWTAKEEYPGMLVLACWKCPVFIGIGPFKEAVSDA